MRLNKISLLIIAPVLVIVILGIGWRLSNSGLSNYSATAESMPGIAVADVDVNSDSTNLHTENSVYKDAISDEKFAQEQEMLSKTYVLGMGRENSDYASYSDEDLERLGDDGDLVALKMLILRLHARGLNSPSSEEIVDMVNRASLLREKAIIYGDKEFFTSMPELITASIRLTDINATAEKKHEAALDILAYQEFFGLRGSMGLKYREQAESFEIFKPYGFPQKLTEEDKKIIREKAQKIYNEYEQKRLDMGLGEFDNSIPDEIAKSYQFEKQYYEIRMGNNAI